jgi:hypothetical protein
MLLSALSVKDKIYAYPVHESSSDIIPDESTPFSSRYFRKALPSVSDPI